MKKGFSFLLTIFLASSAWAKSESWKEILNNKNLVRAPSVEQLREPMVEATGGYQLHMIGDRWGFLFDEGGAPIVAFDMALDFTKTGDAVLGAIGIGGFSLKNIFKSWKKYKDRQGEILSSDDDLEPWGVPEFSPQETQNGYKAFGKLEFRNSWIERNGHADALKENRRDGFAPADFTLADLYLDQKQEDVLYQGMAQFSEVVFSDELERKDLSAFMEQFSMKWDKEKQEFKMVWNPAMVTSLGKNKRPDIPMWAVNYANPLDLLAYKYYLRSVAGYTESIDYYLGRTGRIISIFITRAVFGIRQRLDQHENQLLAIMEAGIRNDYTINLPLLNPEAFLMNSVNLLYLNKYGVNTDDILNGPRKRKLVLMDEAKARAKNYKWLQKRKYTYEVFGEDRFATVSKDGKQKGLMSMAIGKEFLGFKPGFHYYDKAPWYKLVQRLGTELFTWAVRITLNPNNWFGDLTKNFGWSINIYMPSAGWDVLLRAKDYAESNHEGTLLTHIHEAQAGNGPAIPGYSGASLDKLRKTLYTQRMSPFEIPLQYESAAMAYHKKLVLHLISEGMASQTRFNYLPEKLANPK